MLIPQQTLKLRENQHSHFATNYESGPMIAFEHLKWSVLMEKRSPAFCF